MKCEKGHDSHICNDCGVCGGCAVENSNALASVTKRVEELEQDYESSRKELYAQAVTADSAREAAEAKLATAVHEMKWTHAYLRMNRRSMGLQEVVKSADLRLEAALRALGIDPSKEQNR